MNPIFEMDVINERGESVNTRAFEVPEQELAHYYILGGDTVLELGARYGSVSIITNRKLNEDRKQKHVVVEPDLRVWDSLERNKVINGCSFNIVKGFISNQPRQLILDNTALPYSTQTLIHNSIPNLSNILASYNNASITDKVPSYTLDQIKSQYGVDRFNVLIADCEGFLETFFEENPDFYDELDLIIFEADQSSICDYDPIKRALEEKGFRLGTHVQAQYAYFRPSRYPNWGVGL